MTPQERIQHLKKLQVCYKEGIVALTNRLAEVEAELQALIDKKEAPDGRTHS